MVSDKRLNLASQSPRRQQFLQQLGVDFVVVNAPVDEQAHGAESAVDYVERVARLKAAAGVACCEVGAVVLAADTIVTHGGALLGKPSDRDHARTILQQLSGQWHEVITAVVVVDSAQTTHCRVVAARVQFVQLDERMIAAYLNSSEGEDKAGAYAVQGLGGALVRRIEGSYSAVVGLPLAETVTLLDIAGVRHALQ